MSRKKPVKTVKEVIISPLEIRKADDIIITENTKVELNSEFGPDELVIRQPDEVPDTDVKTVIGLASAEHLQKSGWQLIDCHHTPEGKEYKFRKAN